jgi:hypothetical protein
VHGERPGGRVLALVLDAIGRGLVLAAILGLGRVVG